MDQLINQFNRIDAATKQYVGLSIKAMIKCCIAGALFGIVLTAAFILSLELGMWGI